MPVSNHVSKAIAFVPRSCLDLHGIHIPYVFVLPSSSLFLLFICAWLLCSSIVCIPLVELSAHTHALMPITTTKMSAALHAIGMASTCKHHPGRHSFKSLQNLRMASGLCILQINAPPHKSHFRPAQFRGLGPCASSRLPSLMLASPSSSSRSTFKVFTSSLHPNLGCPSSPARCGVFFFVCRST